MTRLAFDLGDENDSAKFTVSDFSASAPDIASPLANVNRWRQQLSLPPIDERSLLEELEKVRLGKQDAAMISIYGPTGTDGEAPPRGTLAAMAEFGGRIWFFKLSGDRSVVESERESFLDFLSSVQFTTSEGEEDGDK